jgi:hypothetical protein
MDNSLPIHSGFIGACSNDVVRESAERKQS